MCESRSALEPSSDHEDKPRRAAGAEQVELQRRLDRAQQHVVSVSLHPGLVQSGLVPMSDVRREDPPVAEMTMGFGVLEQRVGVFEGFLESSKV